MAVMRKAKSVTNVSTEEINNCLYPSRQVHEFDTVVFNAAKKVSSWSDIFEQVFRIPFKAGVWAALDYFLMESTYYGMSHDERILIEVQDPEWTESTMWVTETRYLKVEGEVGILIDVNQLIKNSKDDRLDTDTLLYGSEITVDELDSLEIAAR